MERSPLFEFFRRGEVARDIRLLAAQGGVASQPADQLGLLMLLVADADPEIARTAEATLQAIPRTSLAAFLGRADVSADLRAFLAARGIEPADVPAEDGEAPIVGGAADAELPPSGEGDASELSTLQKIAALSVAQRIALAMKGSREERAVLIRDPNKIVGVAVLSSPKVTDTEVESIAKMATVSDELLRIIANTRAWVKNYGVVLALAKNPKTPVAVSMNLLPRLNERDIRLLAQDRNIPDALRIVARKKAAPTS